MISYKFYVTGRRGQSKPTEKIIQLPADYSEEEIRQELDDWIASLQITSDSFYCGFDKIDLT